MLVQLKKPFTELQFITLLGQVLHGLNYLHTMSPPTIHRDIKVCWPSNLPQSGNILLNSKGQVKLADFGVATQLSDTLAKRQTQIGSPYLFSSLHFSFLTKQISLSDSGWLPRSSKRVPMEPRWTFGVWGSRQLNYFK